MPFPIYTNSTSSTWTWDDTSTSHVEPPSPSRKEIRQSEIVRSAVYTLVYENLGPALAEFHNMPFQHVNEACHEDGPRELLLRILKVKFDREYPWANLLEQMGYAPTLRSRPRMATTVKDDIIGDMLDLVMHNHSPRDLLERSMRS